MPTNVSEVRLWCVQLYTFNLKAWFWFCIQVTTTGCTRYPHRRRLNVTVAIDVYIFCMIVRFLLINLYIIIILFYQASQAWMEWLIKKRKAFDQRGDMAIAAWAEQQQREMNLRVRRLSRSKVLFMQYMY